MGWFGAALVVLSRTPLACRAGPVLSGGSVLTKIERVRILDFMAERAVSEHNYIYISLYIMLL